MTRYVINGRFLAGGKSGVQRTALELVLAIDRQLAEAPGGSEWIFAYPAGTTPPGLARIRCVALAGPKGVLWEQIVLPRYCRKDVLVNLGNSAPMFHPANIVMFHDAQVWDSPSSYRRAFRIWYKIMQPWVGRNALRVLTVSGYSAGRLKHHGLTGERRAVIVPNGLDHIARVKRCTGAAPISGNFVLAISSPQSHKNISLLLEVFRDPRLADVTLALVGMLPPETPLPRNVRQLGHLEDGALRNLYETAQMFLFPSLTEGFGLPPGEAMSCGCPVIASQAGALDEVYGTAAELLNPMDRGAWIAAIRRLMDDSAERAILAQRGRQRACEMTWDRSARLLLTELEKTD